MAITHRFEAFVAFAGGGAKGIVHVGALKALEDQQVKVLGVAGTSAGAIVAALAASGYTADEIIHPKGERTVLTDLTAVDPKMRRPTDFFGSRWTFVWLFRELNGLIAPGFVLVALIGALLPLAITHLPLAIAAPLAGLWGIFVIATVVGLAWLVSGMARLTRFNRAFAGLLQNRLFPDEKGRIVRMEDFGRAGRPLLKIVAANLTKRELRLFSAEKTPKIAVADAVCASIALPVIFRSWRLGPNRFMDGGIVSNLPAWPFDEERELNPQALTLAFDIHAAAQTGRVGSLNWLAPMLHTGFFGRAELNLRAVRNSHLFALKTQLDVLDFDLSRERALKELEEATFAATERVATRLTREPAVLQQACDGIYALVEEALKAMGLATKAKRGRFRVALALQDETYVRSIRRRYETGCLASDPDHMGLIALGGGALAALEGFATKLFERPDLPPGAVPFVWEGGLIRPDERKSSSEVPINRSTRSLGLDELVMLKVLAGRLHHDTPSRIEMGLGWIADGSS